MCVCHLPAAKTLSWTRHDSKPIYHDLALSQWCRCTKQSTQTPSGDFLKLTTNEFDLQPLDRRKSWTPGSLHNHVKTAATLEALLSRASYARTPTMPALAELICDAWVESRGGPANALTWCLAGEADKERSASGDSEGAESSPGRPTSENFKLPQRGSRAAQNNLGQYAWMN